LRDKVKIEPDPSLSPSRAKIEITTKNGRVLEKLMDTLDLSKGREKIKKDLTQKFRDLSTPVLWREKTEKLISAIPHLEEIPDLNTVVSLCD
jgi:hypothetical protein